MKLNLPNGEHILRFCYSEPLNFNEGLLPDIVLKDLKRENPDTIISFIPDTFEIESIEKGDIMRIYEGKVNIKLENIPMTDKTFMVKNLNIAESSFLYGLQVMGAYCNGVNTENLIHKIFFKFIDGKIKE